MNNEAIIPPEAWADLAERASRLLGDLTAENGRLQAEVERLRERLKIAEGALVYISSRNYTGATFVAQEALTKLSVVE